MKKLVYLMMCCFYFSISYAANYQVKLIGLDAELNQGNGSFKSDILHYSSGKLLETKFSNLDYSFYTKENRLVIAGSEQMISLDLGHFKKIFEEQVFTLNSAFFDIETGKKLSVGAQFLEFALEENLLSFNRVGISCHQTEGRGIGEEVIELCLHEGSITVNELELGDYFSESFHEFVPLKIKTKIEEKSNVSILGIRPSLHELNLNILKENYSLDVALKAIFKFKLVILGTIKLFKNEDLLKIKISSAKWWKVSFKKLLLKYLKKMENDGFKVSGDEITVDLAVMEST